jgi:hypothetical protein
VPVNIQLSGDAEKYARALAEKDGGTINQAVRTAVKQRFDREFPNGLPKEQEQPERRAA